jgi:hypothetical protein
MEIDGIQMKTNFKRHLAESNASVKYSVLDWMRYRVFGVKSDSLYQSIIIDDHKINSLNGMPEQVHSVRLIGLAISDLDGMPSKITSPDGSTFEIDNCHNLTSLRGLPDGLEILRLADNQQLLNLDIDIPVKRLMVTNAEQPDASSINTSALRMYRLVCEGPANFSKIPKLASGEDVVIEIMAGGLTGSSDFRDIMPTTLSVFRLALDDDTAISFAGVNKHLKKIGSGDRDSIGSGAHAGTIQVSSGATDILGFAMIDGIKKIVVTGTPNATQIFESYLGSGKLSRSQILSLRQDLINAGFERLTGV